MRRLLGYLRPYKAQVVVALGADLRHRGGRAGAALPDQAGDRHAHRARADRSGCRPIFGALHRRARWRPSCFRYAQNYIMQNIGQEVMYDMRVQIFAHLQHQSLSYFDRNPVGRLISRLTNDVDALNELLSSGVVVDRGRPGDAGGHRDRHAAARLAAGADQLAVLPVIAFVSQQFQRGCARPIGSSACGWPASTPSCRRTSRACWSCSCSTARSASSTSSTS